MALLSLKECDVDEGGVEVDELEEIHFGNKAIIIFGLSSMQFCII